MKKLFFHTKSFVASVIFYICAAITVVSYNMSDVYIDEQGFIHEPFYLIPLGYIFLLFGTIFFMVAFISARKK